MKPTQIFILTLVAMIAFAGNSLLCRLALKQTSIDAASFTFIRIFSGATALWLIIRIRRRLMVDRTASPLFNISSDSSHSSLSLRQAGNWWSALALFTYAAAFSFAYNTLSAGTGALLLFGAVQATMILWGLRKGERLHAIQLVGLVLAVSGLVVLLFPGLSAPPFSGSILMLGAGVAWGIYSLRGKQRKIRPAPRLAIFCAPSHSLPFSASFCFRGRASIAPESATPCSPERSLPESDM